MKVLHAISAPAAGGAEVYVKDLAKRFVETRVEVHVAFIYTAAAANRSIEHEKKFLQELRDANVSYFFLGDDARHFPWRGALRVRDYVLKHEIDIYHAHLTYGIFFGVLLPIPRVYTHHNIKMRVNKLVFSFLTRYINQLIGISEVCALELESYSKKDVVTIDNAVDGKKVVAVGENHFHGLRKLRCVAVGHICEQKNYDMLLESILLLPQSLRERIDVMIVGEGSSQEIGRLQSKISEKGMNEVVSLMGARDDVPLLLSNSHIFLMTSIYEGLPIALIEAARTGLPCIVTDVGGCREVINNCRNGIVVPPRNAKAFAAAISRLIRNPSLLSTYSENAIRLSSIYSITRAVSRHLSVYESLMQSRK